LLEQPPRSDRKYRLGLRPTDVGMRAVKGHPLYPRARPFLEELRRAVSYTVGCAVREDEQIVYLDWLQGFCGHARLDVSLGPGSRLPIDCTSIGKVLLADLPLGQREVIVDGLTLVPSKPDAITQRDLLLEELATVRATGYAVSNGEPKPEVQAVAAPVRDSTGSVAAAVTIVAPKSIVGSAQMARDFLPHLIATTDRISAALGFPLKGSQPIEGVK
jgi:DNA-binding IclR family transcriptional regulator